MSVVKLSSSLRRRRHSACACRCAQNSSVHRILPSTAANEADAPAALRRAPDLALEIPVVDETATTKEEEEGLARLNGEAPGGFGRWSTPGQNAVEGWLRCLSTWPQSCLIPSATRSARSRPGLH